MRQGGKYAVLFFLLIISLSVLRIWQIRQNNERAAWKPIKESPQTPIISLAQPTILVSDPAQGQIGASLTIIEFADFRCPHCAETARELQKIINDNPGKIRLVWKYFPLIPPREESFRAHLAARCAQRQDKFWEYHDYLFNNQNAVSAAQLTAAAATIGLQMDKFNACLTEETAKPLVERSFAEGQNLGVDGTPTIYANGKKWEKSVEEIKMFFK